MHWTLKVFKSVTSVNLDKKSDVIVHVLRMTSSCSKGSIFRTDGVWSINGLQVSAVNQCITVKQEFRYVFDCTLIIVYSS